MAIRLDQASADSDYRRPGLFTQIFEKFQPIIELYRVFISSLSYASAYFFVRRSHAFCLPLAIGPVASVRETTNTFGTGRRERL